MRTLRAAAALLIVASLGTAPADARSTASNSVRTCASSVCADAWFGASVECTQSAADTVTCTGSVSMTGSAGPAEGALVRLPGTVTWDRTEGCGWYVVGGHVQGCQFDVATETGAWEFGDFCCVQFSRSTTFPTITYSSPDPFCVLMHVGGTSFIEAQTSLLGLAEHERVEARTGVYEAYDVACASGGSD